MGIEIGVSEAILDLMTKANGLHTEAVHVEQQIVKELEAIGRQDLAKYWRQRVYQGVHG